MAKKTRLERYQMIIKDVVATEEQLRVAAGILYQLEEISKNKRDKRLFNDLGTAFARSTAVKASMSKNPCPR